MARSRVAVRWRAPRTAQTQNSTPVSVLGAFGNQLADLSTIQLPDSEP